MLRQLTRELSQKFSWNKEKFADHALEDQKISLSSAVAPPSLFRDVGPLIDRARQARDKRIQRHNTRVTRKDAILESLGNFEDPVEIPMFFDNNQTGKRTSLEPVKVTKSRNPYRWKAVQCKEVDGEIIPSDQAYVDMILDHGSSLPRGSSWVDFLTLESLADKVTVGDKQFCYVSTHTINYNGEPVWRLETRSSCDGKGTWGQSSSCTFNKGKEVLRVKIIHKGRKNLGQGWNSRETREYSLVDMIRESGEARQKEMFV
jgi:hypothetical protein